MNGRSAAGFVGEALEYVNTHMTEDISVRDIADALNVSQSYLSHAFKKSTGYGLWIMSYQKDLFMHRNFSWRAFQ